MGLVQRVIEASGISTVSLSMIPEFTAATGVPRLAAIAYPMSRPMGRPHDAGGQLAVLRAALEVLASASAPGTVEELPFVWPETPAEARKGSEVNPPIARLLKRKPWLLLKLVAGDIPTDAGLEPEDSSPSVSVTSAKLGCADVTIKKPDSYLTPLAQEDHRHAQPRSSSLQP